MYLPASFLSIMALDQKRFETTHPWVSGNPGLSHLGRGATSLGGTLLFVETRPLIIADCLFGFSSVLCSACLLFFSTLCHYHLQALTHLFCCLPAINWPAVPCPILLRSCYLPARLRSRKPLLNSPARLILGPCPG